ncbi:MAG TPA: thiamine pyrophosphate-requiring protein [Steroidobacteraceae bacterium]|nr:thiamine pyrophosphate-requiring protein [Steroidobacteraceae bacterium]
MYTASSAILDALVEAGVEYLFANFGSDHPGLLEAIAQARAANRPCPKVITAPTEMVAMSAAHGFAQARGRAQAVLVHVDCGTQALGGAVHNAAKGRVPVLIIAGLSPATQEGEARGSRNEFIQWIQDVPDQRGLVRGYVRYENEVRVGANARQIVHRALQFAHSEPRGPVYLTAAREVLESEVPPVALDMRQWQPVQPSALPAAAVETIANALAGAERPLVVTSYVGRNPAAVDALTGLCAEFGIGVLESVPSYMNFPTTHDCYLGVQWNERRQNDALAQADVVLVIDSDVPWIGAVSKPRAGARIFHVDCDALKQQMPLWYIGSELAVQADAATALAQLRAALAVRRPERIERRLRQLEAAHEAWEGFVAAHERPQAGLTAPLLVAALREAIGEDAIVVSEAVTNFHVVSQHMKRTRPGTLFSSGGGSLGYNGGAAFGIKLARPDALVVAVTGDGSYLFSQPSVVHWLARRYQAPFLHVVLNNGGWRAPRQGALSVNPDGLAAHAPDIDIHFPEPPDYAGIAAAAGGAHAETVRSVAELQPAITRALQAVRDGKRSAVIDAHVA